MSLLDDASIVVVPSGYKAGKVYSVKPTDGSGDLSFTRALDTATRVGSDGLIEKVRTNLLLQSQTLDNASWLKDASSITANAIAAPDGTLTAETLTADGTAATHGIRQTGTTTLTNGIGHSTSIFAKKGSNDFIQIVGSTAPYVTLNVFANFDLNNGVVGTIGSDATATIQDVGNGWFRCTMVATAQTTSSVNIYIVQIVSSASAARGESNSLSTSVFLWGCQLEVSDFGATPYIPTTTTAVSVGMLANVPRLDYLGGGCPKLLLEPQRTNLAFFSEQFNNAYWAKAQGTITPNNTISPDGFQNADAFIEDTTFAGHAIIGPAYIPAGTHTISVFVKPNGRNRVAIGSASGATATAVFELIGAGTVVRASEGHITNGQIESYPNGWYRVSCLSTLDSASSLGFFLVNTATNKTYTGDGTSGMFLYGAQLELGSYATSYIPTLGAAVTRSADAASKTGISALIGQTEGTLFVEGSTIGVGGNKSNLFAALEKTSSGATIRIFNSVTLNIIIGDVFNGSTFSAQMSGPAIPVGQTFKAALAYKENDFALAVNGVIVATDNSGVVPTTDDFKINTSIYNNLDAGVNESQALLFKTRLTNAQLAELTA